jgi:hypothetical protein
MMRCSPVMRSGPHFTQLLPWWSMRESIIEDFRRWQREAWAYTRPLLSSM